MADNYSWLPTSVKEIRERGWENPDIILFSGDAYVDHPSFGTAVIGRLLESLGLKVAIVPQPNWRDDLRDFRKLGRPNLFFGISAGCMDSMVNHYTAAKRKRSNDAYTPDGKAGARPDMPTLVYTKILKELYPDVPVVIGGIEASLRRFSHYDYWQDSLKPSILYESGADMLVYGMGEKPLTELCKYLKQGIPFRQLTNIPQTCVLRKTTKRMPPIKMAGHSLISSRRMPRRQAKTCPQFPSYRGRVKQPACSSVNTAHSRPSHHRQSSLCPHDYTRNRLRLCLAFHPLTPPPV